ncbi:MAG: c-type cytochrome [Pseudomonadota bacterium]
MKLMKIACLAVLAPFAAFAGDWTLDGDASKLAFGSVKKDAVGESHHFTGLSGGVADGVATISVDLASLETWIDIRNERMAEMVFKGFGPATLTAPIDVAALEALAPGESKVMDIDATLALGPATAEVEASVYALRISETRALIATDEMIWVSTEELGVNAGVDKLMEVAELPSITRAVPVTFRFAFDAGASDAAAKPVAATAAAATEEPEAAPTQTAGLAGDPEKGAKVFRKCKACHVVDEEKNKVGPHLVGVFGRQAASVDGYKYSKAFKGLDVVWTPEEMAAFLKKPRDYVKGTKMSFGGLKKQSDIDDVIAYIAAAGS